MHSYYSHLQAVKSVGEEVLISQKSTFRSSAIFPVLHNQYYSTDNFYGILVTETKHNFSTAVHTVGRIYNDIEDLSKNKKVHESGFDIYGRNNLSLLEHLQVIS